MVTSIILLLAMIGTIVITIKPASSQHIESLDNINVPKWRTFNLDLPKQITENKKTSMLQLNTHAVACIYISLLVTSVSYTYAMCMQSIFSDFIDIYQQNTLDHRLFLLDQEVRVHIANMGGLMYQFDAQALSVRE